MKIGQLAADKFDVIYIKEDIDLRNRQRGEICKLLQEAVKSKQKESIIIHNEVKALKEAMKNAQEGDLIIILYEKLEPLIKTIKAEINNAQKGKLKDYKHPIFLTGEIKITGEAYL